MATVTTTTYATDADLAVTAWTSTLLTGEAATSAIFDNSSTKYVDVLIGGDIAASTVTGTIIAGDSWDIYIHAQYSDTATDMGGAIDALLGAAAENVVNTDWVLANAILMVSVQPEGTPDATQDYHWGGFSVASFFGGTMPKRFMLSLHNNTNDAALGTGSTVNTIGVTYTNT